MFRRGVTDPAKQRPGEHGVKLSSLPWTVTASDICELLFGCELDEAAVTIMADGEGRPSGEASVRQTCRRCETCDLEKTPTSTAWQFLLSTPKKISSLIADSLKDL